MISVNIQEYGYCGVFLALQAASCLASVDLNQRLSTDRNLHIALKVRALFQNLSFPKLLFDFGQDALEGGLMNALIYFNDYSLHGP